MAHLYLGKPASISAVLLYARNRIARVYPLFAAVVIASAVLFAVYGKKFPFRLTAEKTLEHLLLHGDAITLWTVSVEFQFYAIFAAIWVGYYSLCRSSDRILIGLIFLTIAALWYRGFNEDRIAIDGYLHVFLVGLLVEQAYRHRTLWAAERWAGFLIFPLLALYAVAFFFWTSVFGGREMYNLLWLVASVGVLVWAVLVAPASTGARLLASKPMVWLGNISFGIYLLHRPVQWFWQSLLPAATSGYMVFVLTVIASVLLAWLASVLIEKPCRNLIRQIPLGVTAGGATVREGL